MAGRRRTRRLLQAAAAAALLVLVEGPAQAQAPVPARAPLCAACHGPQGNTQVATTPSLAGQPRLFLENQLVLIRDGVRAIPEMKGVLDGVPDSELVELAKYFTAQPPAKFPPGAADAQQVQRGAALAGRLLCASCHLPDYRGREQIPRLKGQPEPFLREAMRQFRDKAGLGRDTIMSETLRGASDADLADLAQFLASLP